MREKVTKILEFKIIITEMKISAEKFKYRFEQPEASVNVIIGWTIEMIMPDVQRGRKVEQKLHKP